MTETELRFNAICAEYRSTIIALTDRASALAAENAVALARIEQLEARVKELTPQQPVELKAVEPAK